MKDLYQKWKVKRVTANPCKTYKAKRVNRVTPDPRLLLAGTQTGVGSAL